MQQYKDYTIQSQGDGFQTMPSVAGKIARFWVVNEKKSIRSIFVVARSLTDSLVYINQSDEKVLNKLEEVIKSYIDDGKIVDLEEYPFEYVSGQLVLESNPTWWKKTLKKHLK